MAEQLPAPRKVLDKQFVFAAVAIGAAYAAIIVLIAAIVSREAAGIAGVALTALAVAMFKEFETLRFRQSDDTRTLLVPKLDYYLIALISFGFHGCQIVLGGLSGMLASALGILPNGDEITNFDIAIIGFFAGASFLVGGFIAAKTSAHVVALTYTHVVLGAFVMLLYNFIFIYFLMDGTTPFINSADALSLLGVGLALLGAHLGLRGRQPAGASPIGGETNHD